jgi:DNA-binding CsgD family transcriptional regulator
VALAAGDPAGLAATDRLLPALEQLEQAHLFDPGELIWPWASIYLFALNSSYAERYDDSLRALRLARAAAEEAGSATGMATVSVHLGGVLLRTGRLEEALREASGAVELVDLTPGMLAHAELVQAEALLWLGQHTECDEHLGRALAVGSDQSFSVATWAAHLRGVRLLWDGDAAASDALLEAERLTGEAGIGEPCHVQWAGHAIDAHLAAGLPDRAERVVAWLERHADHLPCRWPRIQLAVGRARMAWHAGDAAAAEHGFAQALRLHDAAELPLSRIETLLAYGRFLRLHAQPTEARAPISEALAGAEAVGAAWVARAAGEELRLAGGKRRRSQHDRDELTDAERRVAHLAADGHSNAEIARLLYLSVNTVQTHLKHVYRKLGISSRRQLMMRRRDSLAGR